MNRAIAWIVLLVLLGASIGAFYVPWPVLLAGVFFGLAAMTGGRRGMLGFATFTVALNAGLMAWTSGPHAWTSGAIGGLRLAAIVTVNVGLLQRVQMSRWLDALRLPRRWTTLFGALFIAMQDIGRDAQTLREGQASLGQWPASWMGRMRAWASLITPLMVLSVRRARIRQDALQLAGVATSSWFVPVVAVTALGLAGRLLLVAVPNVSLVFVVAFAGGLAFGPRIGAFAAAFAMLLSDLVLSGFLPSGLVNVPAMAFVGFLGGALRELRFADGAGRIIAWSLGVFSTFAFSVLADGTEWLLVPEFRGDWSFLQLRLAAGLAFNALPAVVNGFLFALVAGPVQAAFTASQDPAQSPPSPTPASAHP